MRLLDATLHNVEEARTLLWRNIGTRHESSMYQVSATTGTHSPELVLDAIQNMLGNDVGAEVATDDAGVSVLTGKAHDFEGASHLAISLFTFADSITAQPLKVTVKELA